MLRWLKVAMYFITGLYAGFCGLYMADAYVSGAPIKAWTGIVMDAWFVASLTVLLAGVITLFYSRTGTYLAAGGALILVVLALFYFLLSIVSLKSGQTIDISTVLFVLLVPIFLSVSSFVLALVHQEEKARNA